MLNIKADKDGVMIEAEGTTKEMFEAIATAVAGVYKQSIKNAEVSIPFISLPVLQTTIKDRLIKLLSFALADADRELNKEHDKQDIKSADFTKDEPMSFSDFMQKLMGMMEDSDEHGNKGT